MLYTLCTGYCVGVLVHILIVCTVAGLGLITGQLLSLTTSSSSYGSGGGCETVTVIVTAAGGSATATGGAANATGGSNTNTDDDTNTATNTSGRKMKNEIEKMVTLIQSISKVFWRGIMLSAKTLLGSYYLQ